MRSIRNRWIRGVGAIVLIGGLIITGWSLGVTPAAQAAPNPLQLILDKLDQLIAAITSAASQHNHTLRWDQNLPAA